VLQKWEPLKNRKDLDAPERQGGGEAKLPSEVGLSGPKIIRHRNKISYLVGRTVAGVLCPGLTTEQNPRDRSTGA
jgi:hypothetical protein